MESTHSSPTTNASVIPAISHTSRNPRASPAAYRRGPRSRRGGVGAGIGSGIKRANLRKFDGGVNALRANALPRHQRSVRARWATTVSHAATKSGSIAPAIRALPGSTT